MKINILPIRRNRELASLRIVTDSKETSQKLENYFIGHHQIEYTKNEDTLYTVTTFPECLDIINTELWLRGFEVGWMSK